MDTPSSSIVKKESIEWVVDWGELDAETVAPFPPQNQNPAHTRLIFGGSNQSKSNACKTQNEPLNTVWESTSQKKISMPLSYGMKTEKSSPKSHS